MNSLLNKHFYDPNLNKKAFELDVIRHLALQMPVKVKPLQYSDDETTSFTNPKVFLLEENDKKIKIRFLPNRDEALALYSRAKLAYDSGLRVSRPLRCQENMVFFEYIEGSHLETFSTSDVHEISKLHAHLIQVSIPDVCQPTCELGVQVLIHRSLAAIQPFAPRHHFQILQSILKNVPNIFAVFDHQDLGKHNLIKDMSGEMVLIDEEAFGVIPFGYSLVRIFYGRANYKVASPDLLGIYLDAFPQHLAEHFIQRKEFFRALFIARNAVRRLNVGNHAGAQSLIEEVTQL